jgi:hypothetical protein
MMGIPPWMTGGAGAGAAGAGGGFPFGAALAGLGGIGGLIQGNKGQKQQKQAYEFARQQMLQAQQDQASQNALGRGQMFQGLGDITRGGEQAQRYMSGAAAQSYQQAMDAGRQGGANALAGTYARGLQGTSAGQNMQAQAAYAAQNAVGGVTQRIAGLRAQLAQMQGRSLAGQRNTIGSSYMQQGAQGVNNAQNFFNLTGQYAPQVDPGLWGLLGSAGAMYDQRDFRNRLFDAMAKG